MESFEPASHAPQRRLYYVPILHTHTDLGGLVDDVRKKIGDDVFDRRQQIISAIWDRVEAWADALDVPAGRCKVYQDGLPLCGHESQIVQELAEKQSRNHQLLARLTARGAELVGTESPDLLVREYELARSIVKPDADKTALEPLAIRLLAERDEFIAQRINRTLGTGEIGILFIGMLHNVHRHLEPDIEIVVPFTNGNSHEQQ